MGKNIKFILFFAIAPMKLYNPIEIKVMEQNVVFYCPAPNSVKQAREIVRYVTRALNPFAQAQDGQKLVPHITTRDGLQLFDTLVSRSLYEAEKDVEVQVVFLTRQDKIRSLCTSPKVYFFGQDLDGDRGLHQDLILRSFREVGASTPFVSIVYNGLKKPGEEHVSQWLQFEDRLYRLQNIVIAMFNSLIHLFEIMLRDNPDLGTSKYVNPFNHDVPSILLLLPPKLFENSTAIFNAYHEEVGAALDAMREYCLPAT